MYSGKKYSGDCSKISGSVVLIVSNCIRPRFITISPVLSSSYSTPQGLLHFFLFFLDWYLCISRFYIYVLSQICIFRLPRFRWNVTRRAKRWTPTSSLLSVTTRFAPLQDTTDTFFPFFTFSLFVALTPPASKRGPRPVVSALERRSRRLELSVIICIILSFTLRRAPCPTPADWNPSVLNSDWSVHFNKYLCF